MSDKQINKSPTILKNTIKTQKNEINQLQAKLAITTMAFLYVADNSLDGVMIIDQTKRVVYVNQAATQLFGSNLTEIMGQPIAIDFNPALLSMNSDISTTVSIPNNLGGHFNLETSVLKTEWNNEPGYLIIFYNMSGIKKIEELQAHFATHDFLTGLPNRYYFEQQLSQAIQDSHDNKQQLVLLYLNLDNFKIFNDTLGHAAGDILLQKIAQLLKNHIQRGDVIARLGGDEFALILKSVTSPDSNNTIAQAILKSLVTIINHEKKEEEISASLGISIYPENGDRAIELIKNAELAMLLAKRFGKNQYQFFSADLIVTNKQDQQILNRLRYALANKEFIVYYQPIIDLIGTTCCGFEALLRWNHPTLGLIVPEQFLHYAEEMGLMSLIGRWVMQQALDDYNKLNLDSFLFLSINMSADEFLSSETADYILSSMEDRAISTQNLVVEITERAIIRNPEATIKKFKRLSEVGIQIAVDDYGIGYSSLSLLKRLPIAIMKIDKSFIEDVDSDLNNQIIVKSSIQLAHNLGLKVIAEGAETKDQVDFLKQHGCDYIQGYYFSKPLDFTALSAYIQQLNPL